jgi:hypothetical protein
MMQEPAEVKGDLHAGGISQEAAEILANESKARGRRRWGRAIAVLAVLLLLGAGAWAARFYHEWTRVGVLPPRGGLYFVKRVELPVPILRQGDPQWRKDLLGPTPNTIAAEGCALSSAAMVLNYYGIETDPHRLNEFLKDHEGFTPQGG